jgi:hypothetical protein
LIFLSKKGTRWKLSLEFDNSFIWEWCKSENLFYMH